MLKEKIKFIVALCIIILALGACSKEEPVKEISSPNVVLQKITPQKFKIGDTVELIGKNFGASKLNRYVEFFGWEIEENGYVFWSDSLIKVIVPHISGDDIGGTVHINERLSNGIKYAVDRGWTINIIDILVQISLYITLVYLYLKINKVWKRKGDREVADSQSMAGLSIYIVNCFLWVFYFWFVKEDIKGLLDQAIYIIEGGVLFVIGSGFFVKGEKGYGLWNLIKKAFKLERKEANYLIKRFFKPSNANVIIDILHQIAMIDDYLDPKEQELIEAFSKEWSIDYSVEKLNAERLDTSEGNFIRLRNSVIKYLESEPEKEQAAQLRDMMHTLINIDDNVSPEEELIASELLGLIGTYISGDESSLYDVLIVPQKSEHDTFINEILPNAKKIEVSGGTAYSMGTYYSQKYAEMICNQYRDVNLFTIVHTEKTEG